MAKGVEHKSRQRKDSIQIKNARMQYYVKEGTAHINTELINRQYNNTNRTRKD